MWDYLSVYEDWTLLLIRYQPEILWEREHLLIMADKLLLAKIRQTIIQ